MLIFSDVIGQIVYERIKSSMKAMKGVRIQKQNVKDIHGEGSSKKILLKERKTSILMPIQCSIIGKSNSLKQIQMDTPLFS